MAFEKLTDRSELTAADNADLVHVVDVSDTTVDAAGNSKKLTVANLMKSAPVQSADIANFATTTYVDTEVGNEETARITADSNLQIQINSNDTDITSLDTRVTSNENEILSLEGRVTTSEGDIGSLQTQVTSNDSDITSLNTRVTTAEGEIDALQAQTYVESLNTLTGPVTLLGGTDITLSTTGSQITINSTASGGGGGGNTFTDIDGVTAYSGSSAVDFVASTGMSITPNDTAKTITFAVSGLDTDDVTEGATNLYYTAARVLTQLTATSVTSLNDVSNAGSGAIITAAERTKLDGIAAGAEVNVQSDWNAASGDALILNKPTIPSDLTDLGDTPATLGSAGQVLAVASGGASTEWVDQSGGSALTDTDDLPEGATNLYYTDTRVQTYLTSEKIRANYPTNTFTGNTQITATYEQTMMIGNSATSITFQVASGLARDCEILVMQYGAGDITITGATGVTIRTTSDFYAITAGQYAIIGLKQIGTTDEYIVTGERKPV